MKDCIKLISIFLICFSVVGCGKKQETPADPDFVSQWTGTYPGTIFTAVIDKISNTQANVNLYHYDSLGVSTTFGFVMTYSTLYEATEESPAKLAYFTIPTVTSPSFNAYGYTTDFLPNLVGYQNIQILNMPVTIPGITSILGQNLTQKTLTISARGNDGYVLPSEYTKYY